MARTSAARRRPPRAAGGDAPWNQTSYPDLSSLVTTRPAGAVMSAKTRPRIKTEAEPPNPVGTLVTQGSRRRAGGAAYQAERARLAPCESIARQVVLRRGQLGLTQKDLAERVGTSHSAISRLEGGQHRASIDTLERVGAALGLRLVVGFEEIEASTSVKTPIPV